MATPIITIKDLIKVYKTGFTEVIALRGLDLTVNEGEIVAVMGPSGCGKTTMLNILGGLDRPTAGSIIVDNLPLVNLPDRDLFDYRLKKIGFVFQFFNLMNSITAAENVELPMQLAGVSGAERRARVSELLEMVDMTHRATHKPVQMSGGEQQRIAIAVALANNPKVILADEPTGELDKKTGHGILELFRKLREKYSKTLVIVTHDHRVSDIVDRTVFIEDGRIISSLGGQEAKEAFSKLDAKHLEELSGKADADTRGTVALIHAEEERRKKELDALTEKEKQDKLKSSIERSLKGGIQ